MDVVTGKSLRNCFNSLNKIAMKASKQSSSEKKNMQVEAKKAFEEYEMYEEMRNGIKVRAKVSNVERERSKKIELIAVLVRYI